MNSENIPETPDPATGLPVGPLLADPSPARPVTIERLDGSWCTLERLSADRHGDGLWETSSPADAADRFVYLPVEAHPDRASFDAWLAVAESSVDPLYFAVIDAISGQVGGRQSFLRLDPRNQSIEIGDIYWGPSISRSRVATEALFLFAQHAFDDLGYRRFEWKCNALNAPSRRAAVRFGFTFEGLFRRAAIVKGRSRDTAWYSIIDEEWPATKAAYRAWLDPSNFDARGVQHRSLGEMFIEHRR